MYDLCPYCSAAVSDPQQDSCPVCGREVDSFGTLGLPRPIFSSTNFGPELSEVEREERPGPAYAGRHPAFNTIEFPIPTIARRRRPLGNDLCGMGGRPGRPEYSIQFRKGGRWTMLVERVG